MPREAHFICNRCPVCGSQLGRRRVRQAARGSTALLDEGAACLQCGKVWQRQPIAEVDIVTNGRIDLGRIAEKTAFVEMLRKPEKI